MQQHIVLFIFSNRRRELSFLNAKIQENDTTSEQDVKLKEWADKLITVGSITNDCGRDFQNKPFRTTHTLHMDIL